MDIETMDFRSMTELLRNFVEYVRDVVFGNDARELILYMFSSIPAEIRMTLFVALILTLTTLSKFFLLIKIIYFLL